MDSVETSAKTVEEAVAKALRQLGLDRSQVDVEIVSPGRPGILGFGGEPARVVVRPREERPRPASIGPTTTPGRAGRPEGPARVSSPPPPPVGGPPADEATAAAIDIVEHLLKLLRIDAHVTSRPPVTPGDGVGMVTSVLDIHGEDLGLLIGRRGETLASLQYVVNLMLARRLHKRAMVGIDVSGYRRRREESLRSLARRVADQVRRTGQSMTLEPMPPAERRIVHLTLADNPDVLTVSIGEGEGRKVAITPRR